MKIILSGGWGYGNLGDDAILYSSIKLLRDKFPDSTIVVLSYNIPETESIIKEFDNVSITSSFHAVIYGTKHKKFPVGKNFIDEFLHQFSVDNIASIRRSNNARQTGSFLKNYESFYIEHKESFDNFREVCKDANVYVMSGGGYLAGWAEMHISKFCEIDIAKKCNLKTYVLGQTILPSNNNSWAIIEKILNKSDGTFFRDAQSLQDANKMKIECYNRVVPDLVLSNCFGDSKKENYIVLIPFTKDLLNNKKIIIDNIEEITTKSNTEVYITVSQHWPLPIKIGLNFYFSLKEKGINARMIIPYNFKELVNIVASAQMTFSQNLHGLILSYCAHTPVVSLNKNRKFVSFMEMIGQSENLFSPQDITASSLYNCFMRREVFDFGYLDLFRKQIYEAINKTLK